MAFLSSSISLLISRRRSEFVSSGVLVRLPLLSTPSFPLSIIWFCSYCSCYLISWFCLVSSSTMVASDWTYTTSAVGSWLVVDSIWSFELDRTVLYSWGAIVPHRRRQTDDARIVSQIRSSRRESSWCILILRKKDNKGLCCTGVAPATEPPMPKLERVAQIRKIMLSRCKGYPVCVLTFSPPGLLLIYTSLCACRRPSLYPLGH